MRNRYRRGPRSALYAALLFPLLLFSCAAWAEEEDSGLAARAEALRKAHGDGDELTLRTLSGEAGGESFLLAEVLCGRSPAAAVAFAAEVGDPALVRYVQTRSLHPPAEGDTAALLAAAAEHDAQDWQALVERAPRDGEDAHAANLDVWRAAALQANADEEGCASALVRGGTTAARIGWVVAARPWLFQGAMRAREVLAYPLALRALGALARCEEQAGDTARALQAQFYLASVHLEIGQLREARSRIQPLLSASEGRGDGRFLTRLLRLSAVAARRQGEYGRALVDVERGIAMATAGPQRARLLEELGNVRMAIGNAPGAIEAYQAALEIARPLGKPDWTAGLLHNVGLAWLRVGDLPQARLALAAASTQFEAIGLAYGLCLVQLTQVELELQAGQAGSARALGALAVDSARRLDNPWLIANALHQEGAAFLAVGDAGQATQRFRAALEVAEDVGGRGPALDAWIGLARSRRVQGDLAGAAAAVDAAIDLLGSMVAGLGEGQGAEARARHAELFALGVDLAVAEKDAVALTKILETGRAMTLLESLEGRERLREQLIPEDQRERERSAHADVATARTRLREAKAARAFPRARAAHVELQAALGRLDAIVAAIRRAAQHRVGLVYPSADTLEVLQTRLQPGEAYVLFGAGTTAYAALVLEPTGARVVPLGERAAIDAACTTLTEATQDSEAGTEPLRAALEALLVTPLTLSKDVHRVLLSPVGALFAPPLSMLFGGRTVAYLPSATTHGALLQQQAPEGKKVLAFGNPDYSNHPGLSPLPKTAAEAQAVGTTTILGAKATEAMLRTALAKEPRWRALHLACHGVLDMDRPMQTALALTPEEPDDGLLSVTEVFDLQVPADLVVLSACESGRGRVYRAEGIVGLTRAFMHAGAPRVICSLWQVDDDATQALMTRFYELWNGKEEGASPMSACEALAAAQAWMRSHPDHPEWKHPYYWAAWVLWGLPS